MSGPLSPALMSQQSLAGSQFPAHPEALSTQPATVADFDLLRCVFQGVRLRAVLTTIVVACLVKSNMHVDPFGWRAEGRTGSLDKLLAAIASQTAGMNGGAMLTFWCIARPQSYLLRGLQNLVPPLDPSCL